jgi:chromosomal replication initiation ATPase DnaA
MIQSVVGAWDGVMVGPKNTEVTPAIRSRGFHDFTALPSNIDAIEASMRFADGTHPFVALCGPSGWGKSHLLVSVAEHLNHESSGSAEFVPAVQWARSTLRPEAVEYLVLDDVQDVFTHPRAKHVLRQALGLRVRMKRRTLLAWTTPEPTGRVKSMLPVGRQWTTAEIGEPSIDERELVVRQMASIGGVRLSMPVARLIARHLHGNARSILGAIQRLRIVKRDWNTPSDIIPACGVLGPYLLGHEGWDPRDHVQEAVNRAFTETSTGLRATDISCYLMLHEMGLCEGEVASFLKVSPSTAYVRCRLVRSLIEDERAASLVDACRNAVLCGFEEG